MYVCEAFQHKAQDNVVMRCVCSRVSLVKELAQPLGVPHALRQGTGDGRLRHRLHTQPGPT